MHDSIFLPDKSDLDQISIGSCNGDFELDASNKKFNKIS